MGLCPGKEAMNYLAQMLATPVRTHQPGTERTSEPLNNTSQKRAEVRYKEHLCGQVRSTPELAALMGVHGSSSIHRTLKAMAERGIVKYLGKGKRKGQYGKPSDLWTLA